MAKNDVDILGSLAIFGVAMVVTFFLDIFFFSEGMPIGRVFQDAVILSSLIAIGFMVIRYKKKVGQELFVAVLMTTSWIMISKLYDYTSGNRLVFGVNVFTLVAWTFGLVILREFYEQIVTAKNRVKTFFFIWFMYAVLIILIEFVGYNLMGIQIAAGHPGIMGIAAMHVPCWGKIYYLTAGPLFILITDYLNVM